MPTIRFENGPRHGTDFTFDHDTVIGRGRAADLLVDDSSVSRRHAVLTSRHGDWFIEDLGSENGTYINGRRVTEPTHIKPGDQLTLGAIMARMAPTTALPPQAVATSATPASDPAAVKVVLSIPAEETRPEGQPGGNPADAAILARRLQFLSALGRISGQTFDQQVLLAFVLEQLLDLFPAAERAFVVLGDAESETLVTTGSRLRPGAPPGAVLSKTLLKTAIERREAILVTDAQADARFAGAESMFIAGIRSAMCAPMIFDRRIYGIIQVDRGRSAISFDRSDMSLLVGIATHAAMALGFGRLHAAVVERELIERDMMLARRIQQQFLPRQQPQVDGYSFAVEYASALSIGGDFYDFLQLGEGLVGIAVGDVSGKGVSAALYAAKLGSDLRHSAVGQSDPRAVLERLNAGLAGSDTEGMFATLVLATIDRSTHLLSIANAGHTLPLLRTAGGRVSELGRGGNLPLGVSPSAIFDASTHPLGPGDSVTFYTDGVTEGLNATQEVFGEERLSQALARSGGSAEGCLQSIGTALRTFVGGAPQSDDITLVCFGRDRS